MCSDHALFYGETPYVLPGVYVPFQFDRCNVGLYVDYDMHFLDGGLV